MNPSSQNLPADTELDVARIRADFPILQQQVHGKRLVYLDNAATTQKPTIVLETIRRFYEDERSNVHRGVHLLSAKATDKFEGANYSMPVRESCRDAFGKLETRLSI